MKLKKFFPPQMSASYKLTKRKKFLLRECLCVENVSITHRGHLFYFLFMETYWLFTDFKVILHVPIWVLLILGTHPFSGSNSSQIRPCLEATILCNVSLLGVITVFSHCVTKLYFRLQQPFKQNHDIWQYISGYSGLLRLTFQNLSISSIPWNTTSKDEKHIEALILTS